MSPLNSTEIFSYNINQFKHKANGNINAFCICLLALYLRTVDRFKICKHLEMHACSGRALCDTLDFHDFTKLFCFVQKWMSSSFFHFSDRN